jgi:hypothetical protein
MLRVWAGLCLAGRPSGQPSVRAGGRDFALAWRDVGPSRVGSRRDAGRYPGPARPGNSAADFLSHRLRLCGQRASANK